MELNNAFLALLVIVLLAVVITFTVATLFKKKGFYKYVPAIIAAVGALIFYVKAFCFSSSFQDIAFLLLSIALAIFAVASLFTAIIIKFVTRNIKGLR